MNLTDFSLLVYSKKCVMQSYLVVIQDGKITLQLRQAFSLQEFVGHDKDCVQGIARLRPQTDDLVEDLFVSPILLLKNGSLYLIWKDGSWLATKLAEKVEHFWISATKTLDDEFQRSIWVFDGKGVKILSRPSALLISPVIQHRKETVFNMELDFYPFGKAFISYSISCSVGSRSFGWNQATTFTQQNFGNISVWNRN